MSASPDAIEAQARRYLVLFPEWMRGTRGEEAVGLVLDLLPPDAQRLPWRSKLDLVRAGLHARRVGTPPPWVWWRVVYAKSGSRPVPAAWLPWLSTLVQRRTFPARIGVARANVFGPQALLWSTIWGPAWAVAGLALCIVVDAFALSLRGRRVRRDVCVANGLADDGRMRPPGEVATQWRTGPVGNQPVVRPLVLASAAASVAAVPMTLVWSHDRIDPFVWSFVVILAAVLTGWLGLAVWRALRSARSGASGWPLAEHQSWDAVPATVIARLADGACVALGVAIAWASAWVAVGVGVRGAALVPGALLAVVALALAQAERRAGRQLGVWDAVPPWAPQVVVVARSDATSSSPSGGPTLA